MQLRVVSLERFAPAAPEETIAHGAAAPGGVGGGPSDVENWIEAVQGHGVERVLCLLPDVQLRRYHALLDAYRRELGVDAVKHVPMTDHELATESQLGDALQALRRADAAGEPIVVHCLAGIGRTGQVLAAWLVAERGYDPEDAIRTVRSNGRRPAEAVAAGNATDSELLDRLHSITDE